MRVRTLLLMLFLPGCIAGTAGAATCDSRIAAKSGATTATIVELYTAEGCDSCPPADKWFSRIDYRRDGVVPLAFHVDYWDYIGWQDRFAKPAYAQRQRETVTRQGRRTVYTPQVMLDGRDLRAWSNSSQFQSRLRDVSSRPPRASLALDASMAEDRVEATLMATIAIPADRADAALFFAVTEDKLSSHVTAGENKGVKLMHDHVVRELLGPIAIETKDHAEDHFVKRTITLAPGWKRGDLSLIVFALNSRTGEILQALSTPLCRG